MGSSNNLIEKPNINIAVFLKVWQIIELVGIFFLIPISFFAGILFTGDSQKMFNFVNFYILPVLGLLLVVKIFVTIALFKSKRWALSFNLIQNFIFALLCGSLVVLTIIAKAFPILPILFLFFFIFLFRANLKCLRYPFY